MADQNSQDWTNFGDDDGDLGLDESFLQMAVPEVAKEDPAAKQRQITQRTRPAPRPKQTTQLRTSSTPLNSWNTRGGGSQRRGQNRNRGGGASFPIGGRGQNRNRPTAGSGLPRVSQEDMKKIPFQAPYRAYVGRLPNGIERLDVVEFFEEHLKLEVQQVDHIADRNIAFVDFKTRQALMDAIAHGYENPRFMDRTIRIEPHIQKNRRDRGGSYRGGSGGGSRRDSPRRNSSYGGGGDRRGGGNRQSNHRGSNINSNRMGYQNSGNSNRGGGGGMMMSGGGGGLSGRRRGGDMVQVPGRPYIMENGRSRTSIRQRSRGGPGRYGGGGGRSRMGNQQGFGRRDSDFSRSRPNSGFGNRGDRRSSHQQSSSMSQIHSSRGSGGGGGDRDMRGDMRGDMRRNSRQSSYDQTSNDIPEPTKSKKRIAKGFLSNILGDTLADRKDSPTHSNQQQQQQQQHQQQQQYNQQQQDYSQPSHQSQSRRSRNMGPAPSRKDDKAPVQVTNAFGLLDDEDD